MTLSRRTAALAAFYTRDRNTASPDCPLVMSRQSKAADGHSSEVFPQTTIAQGPVASACDGAGSSVEWRAQFLPNGPGTLITKTIVSTLFKTGLDSLKSRF